MGYCCKKLQQTKTVTLTFKRSELLYDVENYSFVEGDIMETENEHARHQVFDIGQSGNVNRVTRVLNLTHAECVEMLYPYTKEEISDEQEALDDILVAPEEYHIVLTLPEDFSLSTVKLLKHLIHEYLICKVLADWMSITNPSSKANWEEKIMSIRAKKIRNKKSVLAELPTRCKLINTVFISLCNAMSTNSTVNFLNQTLQYCTWSTFCEVSSTVVTDNIGNRFFNSEVEAHCDTCR